MKTELLKVSIRQKALFIPQEWQLNNDSKNLTQLTTVFLANIAKLGFSVSEDLLQILNDISPKHQLEIYEVLKEVTGVNKNWTPLVKGWNIPTNETFADHLITLFANVLGIKNEGDVTLQCGHVIPKNTFPLERYNGCPFCKTPFEFGEIEHYGQGSSLKVLELWTEESIQAFYKDLLTSKTALDATQIDSLKILLQNFDLPENIEIGMKETTMLVIDVLLEKNREKEAQQLFKNPNDILRYLWFKHTGFLQIIEPKTIINRTSKNNKHIFSPADKSVAAKLEATEKLKLKYSRNEAKKFAKFLNEIKLPAEKSCEIMHSKRGMWVRFIRALRLAEYSKKPGFERLAKVLDTFYNQTYEVYEGRINHFKLKNDAEQTFALLKKRPGLFARSLFSNMLWFGKDETIKHFKEVLDEIPARLLFTLNMYAKVYFDVNGNRMVKPLGGKNKAITKNQFLGLYDEAQLKAMQTEIENLCLEAMKRRFERTKTENKTIFIEKGLYNIPVAIGDRKEGIEDLPSALMGTKFPLLGSKIRLFMEWGKGLPTQHLDMDLSCKVAYESRTEFCSYSNLTINGCQHSGDIIHIPEKIGTAEYIDIDVDKLAKFGAKYVSFTCNAYSNGSISPNLVVGWMDSKFPMKISEKTGVAYDPSCVQQQIRIGKTLTKGLVFGVLDVEKREIIWLEMSFGGQIVQNLDMKNVETLLEKLNSKLNVGHLLELKATAQNLEIVEEAENADEVYDFQWAFNPAKVTQLLID